MSDLKTCGGDYKTIWDAKKMSEPVDVGRSIPECDFEKDIIGEYIVWEFDYDYGHPMGKLKHKVYQPVKGKNFRDQWKEAQ